MDSNQKFSYWKRPWQKWMILAAAVSEALVLWYNVKEYRMVLSLDIFSPEELGRYAIQQKSAFLLYGLVVAALIGILIIGAVVRSKKAARLAESVLLLGMAAVLGAWLAVWNQAISGVWVFIVLLATTLVGGIYTFYLYCKEKRTR